MRLKIIILILAGFTVGRSATPGDVVLSGYYLGKASVPFFLLPAALADGDKVLLLDLGLFAALTVPASGVLYHRWAGDPEKIALWRNIGLTADLAMAATGAVWGMSWILTPNHDEEALIGRKTLGFFLVTASGLYAAISLIGRIPFSTEASAAENLSVQPVFDPGSRGAGLVFLYRY